MITLLLQIALPVGLLLWLGLRPAPSAPGYAAQALGSGLVLLGLGLAALWAWPPYWLPWLYGLAWVAILAVRFLRGRLPARWRPVGLSEWVGFALALALAILGAWISTEALLARRAPSVGTVEIAPPVGPGLYIVAHGGSRALLNPHVKTLDRSVERFAAWRGQSYALDVFRIDRLGRRVHGAPPEDPAAYESFAAPVVAPCAGAVAVAVDGLPDMPVPEMDGTHRAGNYVVLDCGGFAVALAHLRRGSLRVAEGDRLAVGDPIGEIGNSGASSEPHLHVHAQTGVPEDHPFAGEPLGLRIDGRFLVRNDLLRGRPPASEKP